MNILLTKSCGIQVDGAAVYFAIIIFLVIAVKGAYIPAILIPHVVRISTIYERLAVNLSNTLKHFDYFIFRDIIHIPRYCK